MATAMAHAMQLAGYCALIAATQLAVSLDDRGAYEASIATDGSDLAVAWYDTRARYAQIFARFFDASGKASTELQLTQGRRYAYEPSLQLAAHRLIVGWYDKAPGEPEATARIGAWSREGEALWQARLSAAGHHARNPVIRVRGETVFCAWLQASGAKEAPWVWVAWFGVDGRTLVTPKRVARASRNSWNLNAALDDRGTAWVVFDAQLDTKRSELYLLRATAAGSSEITRLSEDDGAASVYPDIAINGEHVAIVWFDDRDGNSEVYLYAGDRETFADTARRVTQTPGHSIGAYLAWSDETLGVAWSDDTEGQYEVYFRPFDAHGNALAAPRRVTHSATSSLIPSIAPWHGGFALAWNEYQPAAARSSVMFDWVCAATPP
jgi:hypothetical protein